RFPNAVAPRRCGHSQAGFQGFERRLGAAFLKKSQARIEYQEKRDGRSFDIIAKRQLQQHRRLEHPRNWRPQFFQGPIDWMLDRILNGIRSVVRKAAPSLLARQSSRGIGGLRAHWYAL